MLTRTNGVVLLVRSGAAASGLPSRTCRRSGERRVEEATTKAREVAVKFAKDSNSKLGKIKRASQGQFTISPRDKNNPHIKKIRVVSTVEYYLSD